MGYANLNRLAGVALVGLLMGTASLCAAEEAGDPGASGRGAFQARRAELAKLKEENPELFRQKVQEHRAKVRERLKELKEQDPEKFREVMRHRRERLQARLEKLRETDPEKYRQLMEKRAERIEERLQRLKENHPERYEHLQQKNPRFKSWVDQKPWLRDRDNNPPGPRGGPGTNWENRPGEEGGPGASPDRGVHRGRRSFDEWLEKHPNASERLDRNDDGVVDDAERRHIGDRLDRDGNPPGAVGGPGTNWENRPGPRGGPGASPDRYNGPRYDRDNNPPGPRGGRGTNWENPPGPRGGQGAGPDRGPARRAAPQGGGRRNGS